MESSSTSTEEQEQELPEEFSLPGGYSRDYCDKCGPGTQAWVWIEMPDGKELTYCGHHGRKYREQLLKQAKVVHDLTYIAMQR